MKKQSLCPCGSGKPQEKCCGNKLQMNVFIQPFTNPEEREEFLKNMAMGSQFHFRQRGHFFYYGKDILSYKREQPANKLRNEFLEVFSSFMTDTLEDTCPPSWKECDSSFWEELIFTHFLHCMKITPQEKETEKFLMQLKNFVRWLDRRVGTSWYGLVNQYANEARSDLKICEHLLNYLFLCDFPQLHQSDFNLELALQKVEYKFDQFAERKDSLFEVTSRIEDTIVLTESNTNRTYYIKGIPRHLIKAGLIMNGSIGRKKGEKVWEWYHTEGIYPNRGRKYIRLNTPELEPTHV
ncbi:hypothetical protein ACFPA1_27995 [Neobacillus sp. GCM10023253]|uniref:hypothetical protein n=1 Tax=Neobacillus sp. GCM10023253 TaxID=3252644 RepID=UPI00360C1E76